MQIRASVALIIYLASYLPLSIILLCQDFDFSALRRPLCLSPGGLRAACTLPVHHPALALSAVGVCLLALFVALGTLSLAQPKQSIIMVEARHKPADLMNYVLPYVVSFMGIDYKDPAKLLGFVVFFTWIFVITFRSGQAILNPVLAVFGWRLFEVTYQFEGGSETTYAGIMLSRITPEIGRVYQKAQLQDVIVVKG